MTRLIDGDALNQMIDFRMWDVDDDCPHDEASIRISEDHAVKKIIEDEPTVDAVPVIRCRDCRNLLTVAWIGDNAEQYAWMCDHWHMSTDPEGFCHKAKRRKDGNDQQGDPARPID